MSRQKSKLKIFQVKILDAYFKHLKSKIKIDGILLFGSYAYGKPHKDSDVDLVVLSKDFTNVPFIERLIFLSQMRKGVAEGVAMDVFGYTPFEFQRADNESAILSYAKENGSWLLKPSVA